MLLGLLGRGEDAAQAERYQARRCGVFSLLMVPRITRAQKMDALSSMAARAGYKAVLLAAGASGKFFPLLMTAAGTVAPSRDEPRTSMLFGDAKGAVSKLVEAVKGL